MMHDAGRADNCSYPKLLLLLLLILLLLLSSEEQEYICFQALFPRHWEKGPENKGRS